jgi:hypothetical protein
MHIPASNPNLLASESIPTRGTEMLRRRWNVWVELLNVCLAYFIVYRIPPGFPSVSAFYHLIEST